MNNLRRVMADASARQFAVLAIVAAFIALTGGSSRPIPPLIALRPALAVALVASLALPGPRDWRGLLAPAALLLLLAASMLVQLMPVPVSWWLGLAGHGRYAVGVALGGAAALPVSLTPDLTLNSLLALMPAALALVSYAAMRPSHRWATVWIAVALAGLSLLFSLAQIGGQLYIYRPAQDDVAGLLANRNHQAVLLGAMLPLLAVLARKVVARPHGPVIAAGLGALGAIVLPVILLTGSRQGMVLAAVALVAAVMLAPKPVGRAASKWRVAMIVAGSVAALVLAGVATGRAASIDRLLGGRTIGEDVRVRNLPTVIAMTRDFFPVGSGYGSFDPVYRGFEPNALLVGTFFNHAHNDLLEIVLTGGLLALLLVGALLTHLAVRGTRAFRDVDRSRRSYFLDRAGFAVAGFFLATSLVDYPLRTPLCSFVFALALCWVSAPPAPQRRVRTSGSRNGVRVAA